MLVTIARVNEALNGKSQLLQSSVFVPRIHELSTPHAHHDDDNRQDISQRAMTFYMSYWSRSVESKRFQESMKRV